MKINLNIIIDTREQNPWAFPQWSCSTIRGTLKTGDYALEGDAENFAIERKSLNDFVSSITSGYTRFEKELNRMKEFTQRIIIVEADFRDCCFYQVNEDINIPKYRTNVTPQHLSSIIAGLTIQGIIVFFAGDPLLAAGIGYRILKKRQIQIINKGI